MEPWEAQRWVALYKAAMIEVDLSKLPERIANAKSAMTDRTKHLSASNDGQAELEAIADALKGLRILRKEAD